MHARIALNPGIKDRMLKAISAGPKVVLPAPLKFSPNRVSLSRIDLPDELMDFYIARAVSECLQDLYVGPVTPTNVNLYRICEFLGKTVDFSELEKTPHPLS